jgi:hypothetical protein
MFKEYFMKNVNKVSKIQVTKLSVLGFAVIAAIVISMAACGDGGDPNDLNNPNNPNMPAHTHQWGEWEVTTPPTYTTEGEKTRTCSSCDETETCVIPELQTPATTEEIQEYLANQTGGESADDPINLPINILLGNMKDTDSGWMDLLAIIDTSDKYVNLDLSSCTMEGTRFDPDRNIATGKDKIVSLILPNDATEIVDGEFIFSSFDNFSNLKTVNGAGITSIGSSTFYGCTGLTEVDFPLATTIGNSAFAGCTGLTELNFPLATNIDSGAFYNCTSLTQISFSAAASTNENYPPFVGCYSLTTFNLTGDGSLSTIESGKALVQDNTKLIAYPTASGAITMNSITSIGRYAFFGCAEITEVDFPMVTTIGNVAFYNCVGLTEVNLPMVTTIGQSAFYNCAELTEINFPLATIIGSAAFNGCTGLVEADIPKIKRLEIEVFSYCFNLTTVNLASVEEISIAAFRVNEGNYESTTITVFMGSTAPSLGQAVFYGFKTEPLTVIVKVPVGATGYDETWQTRLKSSNDASPVNITVTVEYDES